MPPEFVVIVPYRDRPQQLAEFETQMRIVLANIDPATYRILYICPCDTRPFNRGAMKNIGFRVVRDLYPHTYTQITLVFHDIDTLPTGPDVIPDYRTTTGVVKHFYGYTHALGGIVSIRAADFERINGFPNYWAWGYEDNMLQTRVMNAVPRMSIDRSTFYVINDAVHIRQDRGGCTRTVNRGEFDRYMRMDPEGINTIRGVVYDAPRLMHIDSFGHQVNVTAFDTGTVCNTALNSVFDVVKGRAPFTVGRSARKRTRMNLVM